MASIAELNELINLHQLGPRIGLMKARGGQNYKLPWSDLASANITILDGGKQFKNWGKEEPRAGGAVELVMLVRCCEVATAVTLLHELYELDPDAPAGEVYKPPIDGGDEEFVAQQCLGESAPAIALLQERYGIPEATLERAAKARTLGWNTGKNVMVSTSFPSLGYSGAAFISRSFNPGHALAIDIEREDGELSGVMCETVLQRMATPWTVNPARVRKARTVYVVQRPVDALCVEACDLPYAQALAVRSLDVDAIDWTFLVGRQAVICLDADAEDEDGRRRAVEASWRLYEVLTARGIAATLVDQSEWVKQEVYSPHQLFQAGGAEELRMAVKRLEDHAIAGLPSNADGGGRKRVWLPGYDFATYWRFKVQGDYSDYIIEGGNDEEGKPPKRIPLASFRVASLSRVTVQGAQATCYGAEDLAPETLFAAAVQVPRHGPNLQRRVFRDDELHKVARWQEFGPVYQPQHFARLLAIMERTTHLGERTAANFVGVCWLDGKLVVNEGPDCYFQVPDKQCTYHGLRFQRGPTQNAAKVVDAYARTFKESAALIPLVWTLGGVALKTILGFWPHLEMQAAKGSGKSTLINRLSGTTGFTMFSSQQLKTEYRIVCSVAHSSMPVGWEEISANRQDVIDRAVTTLQECYQFTPHQRGSDNLKFLNAAPVLLAGEDVPARSLAGKLVRTSLRSDRRGPMMPNDLPAFPMHAWLTWVAQQSVPSVRAQFARVLEEMTAGSRATSTDIGAQRMTTNYAALLLTWKLLCKFAGADELKHAFGRDLLAEMNQHIADTSEDREPYIWILEKLSSELANKRFLYPFGFKRIDDADGREIECLVVKHTHVMDHFSSSMPLREWYNSLPVKTARVFKQQCMLADLVVDQDASLMIDGSRHWHCLALSVEKMRAKGVTFATQDATAAEPPRHGDRDLLGYPD